LTGKSERPPKTVEGGVFRFRAAHFEWLLQIAERLSLGFNDVGKRRHGTPPTLFFCDELVRLYGSPEYLISQAASYAVENWVAAGFWDELISGFFVTSMSNKCSTNAETCPSRRSSGTHPIFLRRQKNE
jgi:hypothetical protein